MLQWFDQQSTDEDLSSVDYDAMFWQIENTLGFADSVKDSERFLSRRKLLQVFQRCAALLFIPLLVGLSYLYYTKDSHVGSLSHTLNCTKTYKEYFSPAGARLKVLLPDSTEVWLNGSSSLKIADSFGVTDRNVELIGEGNFHVKHSDRLNFIVSAGNMKVKATGTVFNITAYPDSPNVETVLISGKVEVKTSGTKEKSALELSPNQCAISSKGSDVVQVSNVNTLSYEAWPKGRLVFDNKSLKDVAAILERWYNVKITLKDAELAEQRFTANLEECSIEQLLKYISYSSPITYSMNKNKVTISLIK